MVDPLAEVVSLLQPGAPFSKLVSGAGRWRVRRAENGRPFYCAVLMGRSRLAVDGREPVILEKGDFVLIPAAFDFTTSSIDPPKGKHETPRIVLPDGEIRNGVHHGPPDVRMMVGYCAFASPDASLLVSLLPQFVHVRGEQRLTSLVELLRDESRERRPAREVILARLMEVLLIEALRSTAGIAASPGLLRGLSDERLSVAIRRMHERPTQAWTVAQLAKEAALSRSAFFERFNRAMGVAPMEYLLGWRMALAKDLLRRKQEVTVAEVAEQVGYSSASTFSVAFTRHVGLPPTHYAREQRLAPAPKPGTRHRGPPGSQAPGGPPGGAADAPPRVGPRW
ncbi:AraC family transcriptional regulator [Corallococcus sp. AB032C]|uniref:AraC family transcriptional regulator n=1 Tax=Corallococcus TaxID=83461 RepID=UPI000EC7E489|nr:MULTISPECIES: AraC family transcriptional regulator [Corallococcus]NPC51521.1 AraC family transcriptional regulator [Corallococcus exiguus]RKH86084.1 AraC family transcriptional regulator [Corallococcus sp. AB032C]